jgi:protein involved in polysaccharide export with SLBB domain
LTNATGANVTVDQRGLPFDAVCPSGTVDSGAVQTNYALSFTTEPPATAYIGKAISPAPAVILTESGAVFTPGAGVVTMTDSATLLGGTPKASLSAGMATFNNLLISSATSADQLTASLSLTPNLSPALSLTSSPSSGINVESAAPAITSVSAILPQQTQTITISGSGFGAQAAYTGDSSYINLVDSTGSSAAWGAGFTGSSVSLAVSSWTDSQIVLTGLSGNYGVGGWCIRPGDQLSVKVWNASTGQGPAIYPITASSGTDTCAPQISSVSAIQSKQTQTITISGAGFGSQAAYTGDSSYISLVDSTGSSAPWGAGETGNGVTLAVSSWTDTQIVLTGFSGNYGVGGWCIRPGDQLSVRVWNAGTGQGPATYPIVASSGTDTCAPQVTSVSAILPQQTQTITINGSGFGAQGSYTGDSSYISLVDSSGASAPWGAGFTGSSVSLAVSSWTDTQIVLSGFSGNYGVGGWCVRPGDQLSVRIWNANTGQGPATYPIIASSGPDTCAPQVTSVSPILSAKTQTITINGVGFGAQAAYTGNSSYINLLDSTGSSAPWGAGETGNSVTLAVSSWTDTQIVLTGLAGNYGVGGWCIRPGDQLTVRIWNANTGAGPATYPIVATGSDTCAPQITSVSAILPQKTQTITISGTGFGTQAPYTGDSNYINLVDSTGNWGAGSTENGGNAVTLAVSSWTDSQIVLTGFSAAYGKNGWCIKPGDQLSVRVWNANTGGGPAIYPITANSGINTCN